MYDIHRYIGSVDINIRHKGDLPNYRTERVDNSVTVSSGRRYIGNQIKPLNCIHRTES